MIQYEREMRAATKALRADPDRLRKVVADYCGHIAALREAVGMQWSRIDQGNFTQAQVDMVLVTGVLRELIDAGEGLVKLGLPAAPALARFLASSGGVKDARDVLVHKAAYLRGVGKLQLDAVYQARAMGAAVPDTTLQQFFVRDNAAGTAIAMSIGQDVSSPVGIALPQAMAFADDLLEVGHSWLEREREGR